MVVAASPGSTLAASAATSAEREFEPRLPDGEFRHLAFEGFWLSIWREAIASICERSEAMRSS